MGNGLVRRYAVAAWFALMAGSVAVHAETPLKRGTYLMQSIAACGNCHTTQGADGPLPGMELASSSLSRGKFKPDCCSAVVLPEPGAPTITYQGN